MAPASELPRASVYLSYKGLQQITWNCTGRKLALVEEGGARLGICSLDIHNIVGGAGRGRMTGLLGVNA